VSPRDGSTPGGSSCWPGGAELAISLTVDVDLDVSMRDEQQYSLSRRSDAAFGTRRGLSRLVDLFADAQVIGTFFVPGVIAERHPDLVEAIAAAGHEVGHHGYRHLPPRGLDEAEERDELERGMAALERIVGRSVSAYRAPCWELEPRSLALLVEYGFCSDSSLMDDDRPYRIDSGKASLVEFPVHWTLDDVPFYGCPDDEVLTVSHGEALEAVWLGEAASAQRDRRHITLTIHPEVSGRGYRALLLERVINQITDRMNVWWAPHNAIVPHV
jgi:peptidoglycan-N-acetylglucosamine deacetylase